MSMLAAERRMQILEKLQVEKKVVVSQLSSEFEVSEETIRRDLDRLEKEGFAVKSYGGATLCESNKDLPNTIRKKSNVAGKEKIATLVEKLVQDGEHIMLDSSTTASAIAYALRFKENLTIITNSVEILLIATEASGWNVISTGGNLKEEYFALVGPRAIETASNYYVEKLIFSCKGLDKKIGPMDSSELFSQVKQAMIKSAKEKILAVDCSKFDKTSFSKICDFYEIDCIVTDTKPSQMWLNYFEEKGIRCIYGE